MLQEVSLAKPVSLLTLARFEIRRGERPIDVVDLIILTDRRRRHHSCENKARMPPVARNDMLDRSVDSIYTSVLHNTISSDSVLTILCELFCDGISKASRFFHDTFDPRKSRFRTYAVARKLQS